MAGTGPAGVGGVAVLYLYELKTLLGVATACPIRLDEKYARLRGTARADANSLLCNAMVVIKRLYIANFFDAMLLPVAPTVKLRQLINKYSKLQIRNYYVG